MTKFKRQVISAVAAGAMALNVVTPALATEIVISGNGSNSDNYVTVNNTNTNSVTQNNTANVTNTVKTDADTGDNKANYNTGGNVGIETGNAKVSANVSNNLNSNHAEVDCCQTSGTDVKVKGNGSGSDNTVSLTNDNTNTVKQTNNATVVNTVDAEAETGENKAGGNTGGDVVIKTGNAKVNANVDTTANVNSAKVGNSMSATPTPSASFIIMGNGANTDNFIDAALTNATTVTQNNTAKVTNTVEAEAETGDNDANFNTGGDVVILTGDPSDPANFGATVNVDVDNAVNFNAADVDCGCEFDVLAEISGNGAESDDNHSWWKKWFDKDQNVIELDLLNTQTVGQGNNATLTNTLDEIEAETGENEASSNTGAVDEETDPAVLTGNAVSNSSVSNSGNVNTVGNLPFNMPELPDFDFDFNVSGLWAWMFFGVSN